jgi:hypothetical protein
VLGLERDHVDDEIEAVGDVEGSGFVAVESDVVEAVHGGALVSARDGQLPGIGKERARNRAADVARAAEDEAALRD